MKYYIGEINNFYGEVEITSTIRFATDSDPAEYLDTLASIFWGEGVDNDGYWEFDNNMSTQPAGFKEISKEVFDSLSGTITQLYVY